MTNTVPKINIYEYVFLLRGDIQEKPVQDLFKKINSIIREYSGTLIKTEDWGIRNLAYRIKSSNKAKYCLLELKITYDGLMELQRIMSISSDILRVFFIRLGNATTKMSSLHLATPSSEKSKESDDSMYNEIDYKNLSLLNRHTTERGKILPRRLTNISNQEQHLIANAIKRARFLALISPLKN